MTAAPFGTDVLAPQARPLTLAEFYDALLAHDWFATNSDSRARYAWGETAGARLARLAHDGGPEWMALYRQVRLHHCSGPGWETELVPLPPRPVEAADIAPALLGMGGEA